MKKSRLSMLLALLGICALAVFAAGCGDSDEGGDGSGGGKELSVGSDIPYPPFEQGKAPNYTGYDVELLEAVAENTGREAVFQDTSFDTIFLDLARGKFDGGFGGNDHRRT